jgi:tetratricopeptide (TPR) repeat protein
MFENLSQSLAKHKGKKVYGYLSKKDKDIVDNIVKTIAEDEKIAELYELWYRLQCETFRTYTDQMPPKVPIEENKEFKPLRNFVVKSTADMLPDMPVGRAFDVDYKTPSESEDSMIRLRFKAEDGNVHAMYRLARRYLTEENNAGEAEYWLKKAADKGNVYAIYFLYQCYRDGRIKDTNNAKMKYLLMAVDKKFAYAEYDYGKHLDAKEDPMGLEYLRQAAKHGCVQAEYAIGKRMLQNGQTEEGLKYLESAAEKDNWSRFYLGLMYCYRLNDWDKGMEYLRSASEQGFEPAQNAINNIQKGLNAQIVTGICNLFYYASRIIDDRAESEYPHPAFDAVESRAKKEDRAKRMGIAYTGM